MSGGRPEHDQTRHDLLWCLQPFVPAYRLDAAADALLPVVDAHARQVAADAVENVAKTIVATDFAALRPQGVAAWVFEYAAALREPQP